MILDHVDGLELSDDLLASRGNELRTLAYLWEGLAFLEAQVAMNEQELCRRLDCEHRRVEVYGNAPEFRGLPMELIACSFHWYSVSAANYVRLVGWLVHSGDPDKAGKYTERVLKRVSLWRNKVGAHLAITDPKPSGRLADSQADLAASILFPVGFSDRRIVAAPLQLSVRRGGQSSTSRNMKWSLTETHAALKTRYRPEGTDWPHVGASIQMKTRDEWLATVDLGTPNADITVGLSGLDGAQ